MTPRRRSIEARFCPYCPNSAEASRLSSNVITICAAAPSWNSPPGANWPGSVNLGKSSASYGNERVGMVRTRAFPGQPSEQAIRPDFRDRHGNDVADAAWRQHDLHRLQIGRAADELSGSTPRLFEEHVEGGSEAARIECRLVAIDRRLQPRQALGLDGFGDLIGHGGGRRPRPRRIFERERARIADFIEDRQRLAEIGFGLAREADDEVR